MMRDISSMLAKASEQDTGKSVISKHMNTIQALIAASGYGDTNTARNAVYALKNVIPFTDMEALMDQTRTSLLAGMAALALATVSQEVLLRVLQVVDHLASSKQCEMEPQIIDTFKQIQSQNNHADCISDLADSVVRSMALVC